MLCSVCVYVGYSSKCQDKNRSHKDPKLYGIFSMVFHLVQVFDQNAHLSHENTRGKVIQHRAWSAHFEVVNLGTGRIHSCIGMSVDLFVPQFNTDNKTTNDRTHARQQNNGNIKLQIKIVPEMS